MIDVPSLAELAADARLDAHASQRTFRAMLDALARPGRTGRLHPPSGVPAALVVALALADVDVTTHVLTGADELDWAEVLRAATGTRAVELEHADIVVALRPPTPDEIRSLRRGRPDAPELGARLSLAVESLGSGDVLLTMRGPGVPVVRELEVGGVDAPVLEAIAAVNRRFPAGIDTFLVAADGVIAGIPRSTDLEVR